MRFSCVSSDGSLEDATLTNGRHLSRRLSVPDIVQSSEKRDVRTKRKRSGTILAKKVSIHMARKKDQDRKKAAERIENQKALNTRAVWNCVFVGNVDPSVTEDDLMKMFNHCGEITRIQIRCSRGQGVTVGMAIPAHIRSPRDLVYASIEFKDPLSVRNASKLHGRWLNGIRIVVCISAADLPEVQDIVDTRLSDILKRQGRVKPEAHKPNGFSRFPIQETEIYISPTALNPDRHTILGFSFPKCVI